jgi:hypothetical protein
MRYLRVGVLDPDRFEAVQKLCGHRTNVCRPLVESPMLESTYILDMDQARALAVLVQRRWCVSAANDKNNLSAW